MKHFNLKKAIYLIILVVLVGFLFTIYNTFNSNPISKGIAKSKLNKYIEENYSDGDFRIRNVGYNFKFNEYYGNVVSTEKGLDFNITLKNNGEIIDMYKERGYIEDFELNNRFKDKVEEDFEEALKDRLIFSEEGKNSDYLFVHFNIMQGKYKDRDIQYSNDLDDKFLLELNLYNNTENYKDRFVDLASEIIKYAESNGYEGLSEIAIYTYVDNVKYSLLVNKEDFTKGGGELYNMIKSSYEFKEETSGNISKIKK